MEESLQGKKIIQTVCLHQTDTSMTYVDVFNDGDVMIHELYADHNSPSRVVHPDAVYDYHVIMGIRGTDVEKLRILLAVMHEYAEAKEEKPDGTDNSDKTTV